MPIYAGSNLISTVRLGTVVLDNIHKGNAAALFSNCPALPAPASISVSAGNAQATATWADVAGAVGYQLQYREVGSAEWITTGKPNAPTSLTATAGNAQIALSWTAPSDPGTSAITGYVVEYTPSGGSASTVNTSSTSTSYTLTGLENGTEYTVRVAAISAVGTGDYSATATGTPISGPALVQTAAGVTGLWSGSGTAAAPYAYAPGWRMTLANSPQFTVYGSGFLEFRGTNRDLTSDSDATKYVYRTRGGTRTTVLEAYGGSPSAYSLTLAVQDGDIISFEAKTYDQVYNGLGPPPGTTYDLMQWRDVTMWVRS